MSVKKRKNAGFSSEGEDDRFDIFPEDDWAENNRESSEGLNLSQFTDSDGEYYDEPAYAEDAYEESDEWPEDQPKRRGLFRRRRNREEYEEYPDEYPEEYPDEYPDDEEEPTGESAEESAEESTEDSMEEPMEEVMEEPVEEIVEEAVEEPFEEPEDSRPGIFGRLRRRRETVEEETPESDVEEEPAGEPEVSEIEVAEVPVDGSLTTTGAPVRRVLVVRKTKQNLPRNPEKNQQLVYESELDMLDRDDPEDMPENRDYLPIRFRRYGKTGIGGGLMYATFVLCVSIVLAVFLWMCAADVLALSKPEGTAVVTVLAYVPGEDDLLDEDGDPVDEEGRVITCDVDQVSAALKEAGVIDFKWLFKGFCKIAHAYAKIDPGVYDVDTTLDYRALVTEMQVGSDSQEITKLTFPEGYTMEQIFQTLDDFDICDKEDLYDAAANYDFNYSWLKDIPLGDATRLEGYLFPDTYEFYQGETAVNAINRLLLRFHYILTEDMYVQAENLGITIHDAVIVASLIEKEAGAEDNRYYFASVIYNRLNNGWKLQLDSTVNYAMSMNTLDITYEDLEYDSPYNTYLYEGLPAGPICSPGLASLQAALNPADTNYWYWYAVDGVTSFFTNSADFNAYAAANPY